MPDYEYVHGLFKKIFSANGFQCVSFVDIYFHFHRNDGICDWYFKNSPRNKSPSGAVGAVSEKESTNSVERGSQKILFFFSSLIFN